MARRRRTSSKKVPTIAIGSTTVVILSELSDRDSIIQIFVEIDRDDYLFLFYFNRYILDTSHFKSHSAGRLIIKYDDGRDSVVTNNLMLY